MAGICAVPNTSGSPGGSDGKESTCNAGFLSLIPGLGRSPGGGGHGHPLQYSCLENPMDREAWRAIIHGLQRVGHDWMTKHACFPSPGEHNGIVPSHPLKKLGPAMGCALTHTRWAEVNVTSSRNFKSLRTVVLALLPPQPHPGAGPWRSRYGSPLLEPVIWAGLPANQ